ncbi:MAG: baseplate J/gp47 family protein [Ruminococcus sp.]
MVSYDEILSRMESAYEEKTSVIPDENSDTGIRLRVLAGEIFNIGTELEWFKRQMFPSTATGNYLDYHAKERGLSRRGSNCASGYVYFTLEYAIDTDVTIPSGTKLTTLGKNPLRFVTTGTGVIKSGTTYTKVHTVAEKGGKEYNVPANAICAAITTIKNINVIKNLEPMTGGTDEESDDELRERLLYLYRNHNNGTNIAYYKALAESVDGVHSAGVVPRNRGVGTVDIFIAKDASTADSALISKVQSIVSTQREVNVDATVLSASTAYVNVGVAIEVEQGYDSDEVKSNCDAVVREYVASLGVGKSCFMSRVGEKIQNVEGVLRYQFDPDISFDVVVDNKAFPIVREVIITEDI